MYYVYVIVDKASGKRYLGFSSNLRKRVAQHNSSNGAEYTKGGCWNLVYYEAFLNKTEAIKREKKLKQDGRSKYQLFARIQSSLAGQK